MILPNGSSVNICEDGSKLASLKATANNRSDAYSHCSMLPTTHNISYIQPSQASCQLRAALSSTVINNISNLTSGVNVSNVNMTTMKTLTRNLNIINVNISSFVIDSLLDSSNTIVADANDTKIDTCDVITQRKYINEKVIGLFGRNSIDLETNSIIRCLNVRIIDLSYNVMIVLKV